VQQATRCPLDAGNGYQGKMRQKVQGYDRLKPQGAHSPESLGAENFSPDMPFEVWTSDITYLWTEWWVAVFNGNHGALQSGDHRLFPQQESLDRTNSQRRSGYGGTASAATKGSHYAFRPRGAVCQQIIQGKAIKIRYDSKHERERKLLRQRCHGIILQDHEIRLDLWQEISE
jgi:hypothetical protein